MQTKSPFRHASRRRIAQYRSGVTAVLAWEKQAMTGQFKGFACYSPIAYEHGRRLEQALLVTEVFGRARDRLRKLPQWPEIHRAWDLDELRRKDRAAYETALLREELAELKEQTQDVAEVLEAN